METPGQDPAKRLNKHRVYLELQMDGDLTVDAPGIRECVDTLLVGITGRATARVSIGSWGDICDVREKENAERAKIRPQVVEELPESLGKEVTGKHKALMDLVAGISREVCPNGGVIIMIQNRVERGRTPIMACSLLPGASGLEEMISAAAAKLAAQAIAQMIAGRSNCPLYVVNAEIDEFARKISGSGTKDETIVKEASPPPGGRLGRAE